MQFKNATPAPMDGGMTRTAKAPISTRCDLDATPLSSLTTWGVEPDGAPKHRVLDGLLQPVTRLVRRALAADTAIVALARPGGAAEIVSCDGPAALFAVGAPLPIVLSDIRRVAASAAPLELAATWRPARLGASVLALALRVQDAPVGLVVAVSTSLWTEHDAHSLADAARAIEHTLELARDAARRDPPRASAPGSVIAAA